MSEELPDLPPLKRKRGRPPLTAVQKRVNGAVRAAKAKREAKAKSFEKDFIKSAKELGIEGEVLPPAKWGTPEQSRQVAHLGPAAAAANKPWREALNRAIIQSDGKTLRALAEALIKQAKRGDVQALKEIGDRLDGKSIQQVEAKVQAIVHVTSDDAKL